MRARVIKPGRRKPGAMEPRGTKPGGMRIVVFGLSLSSSWGNGHATTYRALIKALDERGHSVLFLERDVAWYASHRDVTDPDFCRLAFYSDLGALRPWRKEIGEADAVIVGSYVPEGAKLIELVLSSARGVKAFYDIDTPVTLAALAAGSCSYLSARQIADFDLYLSFTGGPLLRRLVSDYGARAAAALYCSADADVYRRQPGYPRWDLGYLGTYSPDRERALERLLLGPARRRPDLRFVVAGAQYPSVAGWPANVEHLAHLAPADHPAFYSSLRWALNITRADMVRAGYSPSVRLFEAASCATPIISDDWRGLGTFLRRGSEIVVAATLEAALAALALPDRQRRLIGERARRRVLAAHTPRHRAAQLEKLLLAAGASARRPHAGWRERTKGEPNRGTYVSSTRVLT